MKLKVSTSPYTYCLLLMTIMDTGYFVYKEEMKGIKAAN